MAASMASSAIESQSIAMTDQQFGVETTEPNCDALQTPLDDLSRSVYCVLGMPLDAVEMPDVLHVIDGAAARAKPFLISTPNLNFLVSYQQDPEFRDSLLMSDLCLADGMPIVWIAQLTGVPIKARVAGSDIFDALKARIPNKPRLKVFFFGGREGVAAAAGNALNVVACGLRCVGSIFPGFGSVSEMSKDEIIDQINASNAHILIASLGANKGQAWLKQNHDRIKIPIRAHLGAAVNFEAGTVKRAPVWMRASGLEWLWRIKEEPHLWRRYANDAAVLLRLMLSRGVPLAIEAGWQRLMHRWRPQDLLVTTYQDGESVTVELAGSATAPNIEKAISCFRDALASRRNLMVDLSRTRTVDARFLGLLLMLRKLVNAQGMVAKFVGLSPRLIRTVQFHGLGFLLSSEEVV